MSVSSSTAVEAHNREIDFDVVDWINKNMKEVSAENKNLFIRCIRDYSDHFEKTAVVDGMKELGHRLHLCEHGEWYDLQTRLHDYCKKQAKILIGNVQGEEKRKVLTEKKLDEYANLYFKDLALTLIEWNQKIADHKEVGIRDIRSKQHKELQDKILEDANGLS